MQQLTTHGASLLDVLGGQVHKFKDAAQEAFDEAKPDWTEAFRQIRGEQSKDSDAVSFTQMMGTNPTFTRGQQILGLSNSTKDTVLEELGLGLKKDPVERAGQLAGTIGSDIVQDRSRAIWWLINAPQALGNIINEAVIARANPRLYGASIVNDPLTMKPITVDQEEIAIREKLINEISGRRRIGVGKKRLDDGTTVYTRRNYPGGAVVGLGFPAGLAINTGLGLMTPFGGAKGYTAVMPDPEDPSKTSNVLGEIAAKYILGRTGNLLPWDEFKIVRPDVSKSEYNAYKAYKWDKELDYDPSDGDVNLLPAGVLKATLDGIHGPEVQFLGKSLGLNETIIPFASSVAGTAAGVRSKNPIRRGLLGGFGGFAAGSITGNIIEEERRRRNEAANNAAIERNQQAKMPDTIG